MLRNRTARDFIDGDLVKAVERGQIKSVDKIGLDPYRNSLKILNEQRGIDFIVDANFFQPVILNFWYEKDGMTRFCFLNLDGAFRCLIRLASLDEYDEEWDHLVRTSNEYSIFLEQLLKSENLLLARENYEEILRHFQNNSELSRIVQLARHHGDQEGSSRLEYKRRFRLRWYDILKKFPTARILERRNDDLERRVREVVELTAVEGRHQAGDEDKWLIVKSIERALMNESTVWLLSNDMGIQSLFKSLAINYRDRQEFFATLKIPPRSFRVESYIDYFNPSQNQYNLTRLGFLNYHRI